MLKLIASDIDGTLVPPGETTPSPELVEIFTKYLDAGAVVALASGRPLAGLTGIFPTLKDRLIYICSNGAHIVREGETLSVTPLASGGAMDELLRAARGLKRDFMVDTEEETLVEEGISEELYRLLVDVGLRVRRVEDISKAVPSILKLSISCPGDPMELLTVPQIAQFSGRYHLAATGGDFFDINSKSMDKGAAVTLLQCRFGIAPEETITFGDAMNDIPMFSVTPNSCAVENAPETVRVHAAHTVAPPEQGGVAKCLERALGSFSDLW